MIASNFGVKRFLTPLAFILFLLPRLALAQTENWAIESFNADVFIPKDGKVQVTETITADFGEIEKHGIYRTIETTDMRFKLLGVKQDGVKAITKVSSAPKGKEIRIGDPDQTITGQHTYEITYEVGRVVTRFSDYDEFYWDVTGSDWTIPIEKVMATVTLEGECGVVPQGGTPCFRASLESQIENVVCYTGPFGAREQDCVASMEAGVAHFETKKSLLPGNGLTIVYGFSKGLVANPFYIEDVLKPLWAILGSLAALVFILRQWWRHGRDMWYRKNIILNPEATAETKPLFTKEIVVVEFDPPRLDSSQVETGPPRVLRPAEVGTLIDEKVDIHDISATIVDLAVRGYLKIGEKQEGRKRIYWFEKLKGFEEEEALADYEKEVLRGLFEKGEKVELDDLKDKFYKHLAKIRDQLYELMKTKGYFTQRPDRVKLKYAGVGIVILALSFIISSASGFSALWFFCPAFVLGFLLLIFSPFMPKKTAAGTEAIRRASGFKLFISKAEKYHQQFNERINRFDQFLPYAMVFGVVDKWVKAFEKLGIEPPQPGWYVAPYAFNAGAFSSSMGRMGSALASTLPSTPAQTGGGGSGFGGGGFSGGGFGGGGGGGW